MKIIELLDGYVTKYGQDESDAFTVGRLVHLMALEPHRMQEYDIIDVQSKNTNMWKDAKAKGGQIITKKEYNEARRIADALLRNEHVLGYIQGCEFDCRCLVTQRTRVRLHPGLRV